MKSLLKVAVVGAMFISTNFGFAQNSESKWEVEYQTNDFGDKNGKCRLIQTCFNEKWSEYEIVIVEIGNNSFAIGVRTEFKDEITDRKAYLSLKTENNKVIEFDTGFYDSELKIAIFDMTNEIISLFKSSSKLKIALRLSDYNPSVIEVDCMGFTKAFNEMISCK